MRGYIDQNGTAQLNLEDVCKALDIGNPTQALTRLDEEDFTLISNEGGRGMNIVNESGLYSLVLGSRKPEAKVFRRWVTREVVPSIRKHGLYATESTIDTMLHLERRFHESKRLFTGNPAA